MDTLVQWLLLVVAIAIGWGLGRWSKAAPIQENPVAAGNDLKSRVQLLFATYSEETIDRFIQSLEVSPQTVDMHLSIGTHFRKRGEVEKAILVHQNLLSHPELLDTYSEQATFELARDYAMAGLFDRAESLLKQISSSGGLGSQGILLLLDIYEQEKDWGRALETGLKLDYRRDQELQRKLAHYCCEMAELAYDDGDYKKMQQLIQQALEYDRNCVRATLNVAHLHMLREHYSDAITIFKKVLLQDPDFVPEIIAPMFECAQNLGTLDKLIGYLIRLSRECESVSVVLAVVDGYMQQNRNQDALEFLVAQLQESPNLRGLDRLVELEIAINGADDSSQSLYAIQQVTGSLIEKKPVYQCTQCGFSGRQLHWQCPSCKVWGGVKPIQGVEGE